ncbi:conserved hypothetical protein [Nitrospira defluvii]|uniref:Uncharacterized protein n=1 Tax=Nitrospira defluvii TaxID=330214 RepID=A0ABN7LEC8_9BACT|nr:conserved hypothetical protein [Nitrospira defluvii]
MNNLPSEEFGRDRLPTNPEEASYGNDFLPNMMETNHLGSGSFLKMTADRIANFCWKFGECIGLSKNRWPQGSSNETTLRRLFNYEDQLCHTLLITIALGSC